MPAIRYLLLPAVILTLCLPLIAIGAEGSASVMAASPQAAVSAGMDFSVRVRDLDIHHPEFAIFVMPGERVSVKVGETRGDTRLESSVGQVSGSRGDWVWTAPKSVGSYDVKLKVASLDAFKLRAFVMRPASDLDDDYLDDFEIGEYPEDPLYDLDVYLPPKGFVQLVSDTFDLPVSPHFRLGQFRCKQEGGFPSYVVLREKLLIKLEMILDKLSGRGIHAETLHVMSGYRTPEYNDDIGNGEYSRHIYGDAADIFVDQNPRDGHMDDLNGDGRTNQQDAVWLSGIIDEIDADPANQALIGGMGIYTSNDYHGPFVHVDVRGFKTRWNQ